MARRMHETNKTGDKVLPNRSVRKRSTRKLFRMAGFKNSLAREALRADIKKLPGHTVKKYSELRGHKRDNEKIDLSFGSDGIKAFFSLFRPAPSFKVKSRFTPINLDQNKIDQEVKRKQSIKRNRGIPSGTKTFRAIGRSNFVDKLNLKF